MAAASVLPKLAVRSHKRSYLVFGAETKAHKDVLKALGLKWNGTLQGWILSKTKSKEFAEVIKLIVSVGGDPTVGADLSSATDDPPIDASDGPAFSVAKVSLELGSEMINSNGVKIQVAMMEKNNGVISIFIGTDKKKYINTQFGWLCIDDVNEIVMKQV